MERVQGIVVHCSRFGCIVRLDDGRLAALPSGERGIDVVKRAVLSGRRPHFPFVITEEAGRRIRLALEGVNINGPTNVEGTKLPGRFQSSFEQKIIDFWRQASEWDRNAGRVDEEEPALRRADRLRPFEERAPNRYRDTKKRPRRRT